MLFTTTHFTYKDPNSLEAKGLTIVILDGYIQVDFITRNIARVRESFHNDEDKGLIIQEDITSLNVCHGF